jgi:hypothetical protein
MCDDMKDWDIVSKCYACNKHLTPDNANPDTEYQFDNALWIGFHGGYGMFVDNLEAKLPNNTEDRWLRDKNGEYLTFLDPLDENARPQPVENLDWEPIYNEDRMLPGQPDYEVVICHDCAHELCEKMPWIERLLNAHNSHAHRTAWKDAHPEHYGWDYDNWTCPRCGRELGTDGHGTKMCDNCDWRADQ